MTSFFSTTAPTIGFGCARPIPLAASARARSMRARSRSRTPSVPSRESVEEGIDIGLRVEGDEMVDFFARADEAEGEIQLARDGDDYAALSGAVEFGEHDAGDSGLAPELAGLVQ